MSSSQHWSSTTSQTGGFNLLRLRKVPDVPEEVIADHFNDPNYDLQPLLHSTASSKTAFELESPRYNPLSFEGGKDSEALQPVGASDEGSLSRSRSPMPDFDDESPYAEVRAAVSSVDDPSMPVNTFRAWTLGLLFTILVSGLNQFFSLRFPSVLITGIVVQLASLPLGKFLAWALPRFKFHLFGFKFSLNPSPFTVKEHVLITVMASSVVFGAYGTDIIATQHVAFKQTVLPMSYHLLLPLSIQLFGFSLGGYLQNMVVYPASMLWPSAIVSAALFNTLHNAFPWKSPGKHISREKFFILVTIASALWYWVPGYLFTALSVANWPCWIAPSNQVVNALFGSLSGLGMGVVTLDWAQIAYVGSPLVSPWWSEANTTAALFICFWLIAPILYYANAFYTKFLPISSGAIFDRTAQHFLATEILTDGSFDLARYRAYSPVYLPATLIVAYGCAFASCSSILMHTFLWYRGDIVHRFRSHLRDERDVHCRLMLSYSEVPHWWSAALGLITVLLLLISIHLVPTQLPIWGASVALVSAAFFTLPTAIIQAISGQTVGGIQVVHELIAGYALPGKPVANMIWKAVAQAGSMQAVLFCGNMKLGQYMKIPPRLMWTAQVIAVVVGCVVVSTVQAVMLDNVNGICEPNQKDGFVCPSTNVFASAAVIWGGVGPSRLFGPGTMYTPLLYLFPIGFLLPIPFYLLSLRYPLSIARYVNIPVFFSGIGALPPATGLNYSSWALTGFIFNFVLRRYKFRWWMRYNYILSAGLDSGVALGIIIVFFAVQFRDVTLDWVGNTIWERTADARGQPGIVLPSGETFGPNVWK